MSCGVCSVVCPTRSICYQLSSITGCYKVQVNDDKCINCGLCRNVCPVLNTEDSVVNPMNCAIKAYAGYSKDPDIRRYAASGGFITSLLMFILETRLVDGVLISRRNGIEGKSFIATTKKEILESKTSIYAPVDYANGLKELKNTNCKKIAVVGLPCHIQAISNWTKVNKTISDKIFIKIAIVCGKTPSLQAYRYVADQVGFEYDGIKSVSNRGDGWPGYMIINHQSGYYKTSYCSKMSMGTVLSSPFLCNRGCLSCIDGLGISADISVCDAWLPQYIQKKDDGWNLILVLTEKANDLLKKERVKDYLHMDEESICNFYLANKRVIDKADTGNMMRSKQSRNNEIKTSRSLKKWIYVLALKAALKVFKQDNLNSSILFIGKVVNKLR